MQHHTLLRVIKSGSADMTFTGWASTPSVDRVGDIVDPLGAKYVLPLTLLWQHRHDEPVGIVKNAHVTPAGIRVAGKLTAGVSRAIEAWALLQDGALALSVGFQALETKPLPGGGLRFVRWDWHELSLVSVPANPEARIVGKGLAYPTSLPEVPEPIARKQHAGPIVGGFDFEAFGAGIGETIRETIAPLRERIKALEDAAGLRGPRT